jgi:hypothetical protein
MPLAPPRVLALIGLLLAAATTPAAAFQVAQEPPIPALLEPTFLLSTGRVVDGEAFRGDGRIVGTTRELAIRDQSLTAPDQVFVPMVLRGHRLGLDELVQFYRIDRPILDPWTGERLGRLLVPTGLGIVDSLAGDVARVQLTHGFHPVLIGDYARPVTEDDTLSFLPRTVMSGIEGPVIASQEVKAILPPFDRIFLRAPTPMAVAPGQVVLLYRPGPVEQNLQLPDVPIGRAMIVRVEDRIAAAVLYETYRSDLTPGDRFRSEASPDE